MSQRDFLSITPHKKGVATVGSNLFLVCEVIKQIYHSVSGTRALEIELTQIGH